MEKVISARLPEGLYNRLAIQAVREMTDQSTVIRRALAVYLEWEPTVPENETVVTSENGGEEKSG